MKTKYNISSRNVINTVIILTVITFVFGFLPNIISWLFALIEIAAISLIFTKKICGQRKITVLQFSLVISTLYIIFNTRTFNSNALFHLLYVLIGLMTWICINRECIEVFYNSLKYFAVFGCIAGLTSIIEVVFPSGIIAIFRIFAPGSLEEINSFLIDGRFLGITNYVWYTSLMLFIGGGYLISNFSNVKGREKVRYLFILIVLLLASFLSGSRSSIVLFPVLISVFYSGENKVKYFIIGIIVIAILYFLITHINFSIRSIIKIQELFIRVTSGDVLDVIRADLKNLAASLFAKNKLFGIGWYEFKYYSYSWLGKYFHTHNLYYQLLAENGIVGTIIITLPWVIVFINTAKSLIKNRKYKYSRTYHIAKLCFMLQVYMYIASFVHVTIYNGQTMLLFYFILGISAKIDRMNMNEILTHNEYI